MTGTMLLYIGIGLMAAGGILAIICGIALLISGKKLRKQLEEEYGKRRS